MERRIIKRLNARHQLAKSRLFTVERFRRLNGIDSRVSLCTGLVQVWWAHGRTGQDGFARLVNPTPDIIREVRVRQAQGYYWNDWSSDGSITDETRAALMKLKFGTITPAELHSRCRDYGAESTFELDLMLQHDAPIVARHVLTCLAPDTVDQLSGDTRPGLRLFVLRYRAPQRTSGQAGHRLAFIVRSDGSVRFFDPNCGEMWFWTAQDFYRWLVEFWEASGYSARVIDPAPDTPAIRVFQFDCAFLGANRPGLERPHSAESNGHIGVAFLHRSTRDRCGE